MSAWSTKATMITTAITVVMTAQGTQTVERVSRACRVCSLLACVGSTQRRFPRRPSRNPLFACSRPGEEEALLRCKVRRPLDPRCPREPQVGAQRVAHRLDESGSAARRKAVLPPGVQHLHAVLCAVDLRLDSTDE